MKYKFNTHYIVTKGNNDTILDGDRLFVEYRKNFDKYSTLGEYIVILPARPSQKSFFGMEARNSVLYFNTKEELSDAMNGIDAIYDVKLANEIINEKQKEIDKIKKNHELNTVSDDQKYDDSKSGDDYYDSPFNGVFQG